MLAHLWIRACCWSPAVGIFLTFFLQTHVFSQTVGLEEIKRGWEEYTKVYFQNHKYVSEGIVDTALVQQSEFSVYQTGNHRLVKNHDRIEKTTYLGAENEDYVFNLKKGSEDSAFALDKMSFQANRVGSDFFSWEMDLVSNPKALYFSPQIKWQSQLLGQYTKIRSMKQLPSGEVDLEFDVVVPKEVSEGEFARATGVKAVFQGPPYYLPIRFSYKLNQFATQYEVSTKVKYSEDKIPQILHWIQTASVIEGNDSIDEAVQSYTFDYEVEAPSSADFRLTAYGLKEPESIPGKPSSFNYAWALLAFGIVVVVVGLFLRFKTSRS